MHNNHTQIHCPNCNHTVDVHEIVYQQLSSELQSKFDARLKAEQQKLIEQQSNMDAMRQQLAVREKNIEQQIGTAIEARLSAERNSIAKQERAKADAATRDSIKAMQDELDDNARKLKTLTQAQAEVSRLQREKDSLKTTLEAENEQRLAHRLSEERLEIQKVEAQKNELKIKEKEHLIETLSKQLSDAQRRAEQGSMQAQGEVQELAVEAWLAQQFPTDTIEEIKKGALGGDCVQTIHSNHKRNCGSIYYESKRTKHFSGDWIEKFKADIRDRNTDIGVLVSQARPQGLDRMGMLDGVWVCNYEEFKGLCQVLRNHIIQLDHTRASQENRGDKMSMLYEFLQSNEFRLQVEAIVDGFTQMKQDLDREKRSMNGHWKRREKQIEKVLLNTGNMYHSIKGIAGASIKPVPELEFEEA
jgi:hypothetical protein